MKYRMLFDSALEPQAVAGATVYKFAEYDYGLASDDTRATGQEHISVTLNADGKGPSFTVPVSHLEAIQLRDDIGAVPVTTLVVSLVAFCFWVAFFL